VSEPDPAADDPAKPRAEELPQQFKPSKADHSLFSDNALHSPAPPGAEDDATVISTPDPASRNGDPTPLPACLDASASGVGADSYPWRPAPLAGLPTSREGDPNMRGTQLALPLHQSPKSISIQSPSETAREAAQLASGEKAKARDILDAIRVLKWLE